MSSVTQEKTRSCDCSALVRHRMSGHEALERTSCPGCGKTHRFVSYVRMDIALSEYCNLTCQMCRRPSEALFIDEDLVARVLSEAAALGFEFLSFSGGEPFVHPAIRRILAHAVSLGVKVQMVTNGTLVKESDLDLLAKLDCVTVSVDGLFDVHDHIRQRPGTFLRTEKTIRWLAADRRITWGTSTVMQRDNAHQLYDVFAHFQELGGVRYAYCNFAHCELTPDIAHLRMSPEQQTSAREQLRRIGDACEKTNTYFSQRDLLLEHFDVYADKEKRYRPLDGCKIPQKFLGFSEHGFYPCWHQGRNLRSGSLVEALESELARDIVLEGLERRCVGCNAFNYAWDDEWNAGVLAAAQSGDSVAHGIVPLRVPSREGRADRPARAVDGRVAGRGAAYIDLHDD